MTYYREERQPPERVENLFECQIQDACGYDIVARPHVHDYFEALYCLEGGYILYTGGALYPFRAGEMVFIDPNEVHHTRSAHPGRNRYLVLKFVPEALLYAEQPAYEMKVLLPYLWSGAQHRKKFEKAMLEGAGIGQLLLRIHKEYRDKALGYEMAVRADIGRLFLWVVRTLNEETGGQILQNLDGSALMTLQRAFAYIDQNCAQALSMGDAARHCGMKYAAFSRFFAKYARLSFPEYLNQVRLKRAAILLTTTALSVTDVSMAVGFSTTSYFIQRFRQQHGLAPGQYRRQFLSSLKPEARTPPADEKPDASKRPAPSL